METSGERVESVLVPNGRQQSLLGAAVRLHGPESKCVLQRGEPVPHLPHPSPDFGRRVPGGKELATIIALVPLGPWISSR